MAHRLSAVGHGLKGGARPYQRGWHFSHRGAETTGDVDHMSYLISGIGTLEHVLYWNACEGEGGRQQP
jgi:hypothetical protein